MSSGALLLISILATISIIGISGRNLKLGWRPDWQDQFMHSTLKTSNYQSYSNRMEEIQAVWLYQGIDFVEQKQSQVANKKIAKNLILFLGDGMGVTTQTAARNYIAGEHTKLSFENFPYVGLSKTYSVDRIVADSASTATSYLCGVKANFATIGVNAHVARSDCQAMLNTSNYVDSIAKWALEAGKMAGLVTTTRVTHASPAGVYAHTADREWETDANIVKDCGKNSYLSDIADQLINGEVGRNLSVIMGGGKSAFLSKELYKGGWRLDKRNLIQEYLNQNIQGNVYVESRMDMQRVDFESTERLLGLFSNSHMDYHLEAMAKEDNTQPTLAEMTQTAIEFMQFKQTTGDNSGYFLFVEGGKIDIGHHFTKARLALDETKEFSEAIHLARQLTNDEDTLIVVTADHSHTFSIGGYQQRGSDIFSLLPKADDEMPFSALNYANGPGFHQHFNTIYNKRVDPNNSFKGTYDDTFPSMVPLNVETHGGEDVGVFASGPWSHLFTGVYEQNAIPHLMAYAACLGPGLKACNQSAQIQTGR